MPRSVNIPTESTVTVGRDSLSRAYRQYQAGERLSADNFAVLNKALKGIGNAGIVEIRPGEEGREMYGLTSGGDNPFAPFLSSPADSDSEDETMATGNRRPNESEREYAARLGFGSESGGSEPNASGAMADQARRLLSGAGGGGPTGEATRGVDPSAGGIPGTPEAALPSNFEGPLPGVRDSASDPTGQRSSEEPMVGPVRSGSGQSSGRALGERLGAAVGSLPGGAGGAAVGVAALGAAYAFTRD